MRVIKQGLWFALDYYVLMVKTALTGHLHTIGGAIAHQTSSVLVILNAMRLLRYRQGQVTGRAAARVYCCANSTPDPATDTTRVSRLLPRRLDSHRAD